MTAGDMAFICLGIAIFVLMILAPSMNEISVHVPTARRERMMTDDVSWDDDPNDPMPDMTVHLPSVPLLLDETGEPDMDQMMAWVKADVHRQLEPMTAWWDRRIARERLRPSPHPDTKRIAHNVEADE